MADLQLIQVPYDSGRRGWRHGAGPASLVAAGAVAALGSAGGDVGVTSVECESVLEAAAGVEAMRGVAAEVAAAAARGRAPVVLAGNCGVTLGVVAGLRAAAPGRRVAVLWLDAHGDLQTPATSTSGFFDGMGFAMLTGRCWQALATSVPGHEPLPDARAVLVGGHDLDEAERELLASGGPRWLSAPEIRSGVDAEQRLLADLAAHADAVHLHVDLDVHDTSEGRANSYAADGGLTAEEVRRVARAAAERLPVVSATVASWDPALDTDHRLRRVGLDLLALLGGLLVA